MNKVMDMIKKNPTIFLLIVTAVFTVFYILLNYISKGDFRELSTPNDETEYNLVNDLVLKPEYYWVKEGNYSYDLDNNISFEEGINLYRFNDDYTCEVLTMNLAYDVDGTIFLKSRTYYDESLNRKEFPDGAWISERISCTYDIDDDFFEMDFGEGTSSMGKIERRDGDQLYITWENSQVSIVQYDAVTFDEHLDAYLREGSLSTIDRYKLTEVYLNTSELTIEKEAGVKSWGLPDKYYITTLSLYEHLDKKYNLEQYGLKENVADIVLFTDLNKDVFKESWIAYDADKGWYKKYITNPFDLKINIPTHKYSNEELVENLSNQLGISRSRIKIDDDYGYYIHYNLEELKAQGEKI